MRKFEPSKNANARKLAKIKRLESLLDEAAVDLFSTWPSQDEMKRWKVEKLQEIVDSEIESTYRRDEVLWKKLFLARQKIHHATSESERKEALIQYETARFDALAWPYTDSTKSRFLYGRYY